MEPSDIAKKLIFDHLVKKAISKLIISIPFFGLPVVNPVFLFIAEKLYSYLYEELKFETELLMIGIKTDHQKEKYDEAVTEFKKEISQGKSDEEMAKAQEEFKNRLRNLISLRP